MSTESWPPSTVLSNGSKTSHEKFYVTSIQPSSVMSTSSMQTHSKSMLFFRCPRLAAQYPIIAHTKSSAATPIVLLIYHIFSPVMYLVHPQVQALIPLRLAVPTRCHPAASGRYCRRWLAVKRHMIGIGYGVRQRWDAGHCNAAAWPQACRQRGHGPVRACFREAPSPAGVWGVAGD